MWLPLNCPHPSLLCSAPPSGLQRHPPPEGPQESLCPVARARVRSMNHNIFCWKWRWELARPGVTDSSQAGAPVRTHQLEESLMARTPHPPTPREPEAREVRRPRRHQHSSAFWSPDTALAARTL